MSEAECRRMLEMADRLEASVAEMTEFIRICASEHHAAIIEDAQVERMRAHVQAIADHLSRHQGGETNDAGKRHWDALTDLLVERRRQIVEDRLDIHKSDTSVSAELARAAACYALHAADDSHGSPFQHWPWHPQQWKPEVNDPYHTLVKAGALILAALERLLRQRDPIDGDTAFDQVLPDSANQLA